MRYLDVCTGLSAASVAWRPLGWTAAGFAEIDKFPCRVLAHHYPGVHNHGDFTTIDVSRLGSVDLLVGGTPCQAFSVAGKRQSLADARGNLTLAYTVLAHELARSNGLRWAVWENVPGVLSTDDNAFGCFLGSLVGSDDAIVLPRGIERWPDAGMVSGPRARAAWRILDAQYFGLAQRRRRVFVVAGFADGADPAAVLFERKGMCGNSPPRRQAGQGIAAPITAGSPGGSGYRNDPDTSENLIAFGGNRTSGPLDVATAVNAHGGPNGRCDFESETFIACSVADSLTVGANQTTGFVGDIIAHSLRADGFDASEDGTGRGTPLVPVFAPETAATLTRGAESAGKGGYAGRRQEDDTNLVAFDCKAGANTGFAIGDIPGAIRGEGHGGGHAAIAIQAGALRENPASGPDGIGVQSDLAYTVEARAEVQAVAFDLRGREGGSQFEGPHETANIRASNGGSSRSYVAQQWAVRRLTPIECARLQGFPDDYLALPGAADGPQYKALGNSFAVPVVRWIGERIAAHDASLKQAEAA